VPSQVPFDDQLLHATDLVLPVGGLVPGETSRTSKLREVCGTAFNIGADAYLTAGHVWKQALTHPLQALGMMDDPQTGRINLHKVTDAEVLDAHDLAVLEARPFGRSFRWTSEGFALQDGVHSFGYPHGFDPDSEAINIRAFRGSIVGGSTIRELPARPPGLEVSFPCPRGLSGAPLIRNDPKPNRVVGVILANHITEMDVYTEKETTKEGEREQVFIKTEALHLGIAIRADVVCAVESRLLGCTIGDWLRRCDLLTD
jgi:hypothetical protein